MGATKHTPGPWTLETRGDGATLIVNGQQLYIGIFGQTWRGDEAQANARLIVSAPELLDACQSSLRFVDNLISWHPPTEEDTPEVAGLKAWRDSLSAAIAKAEASQ